MTHNDKCLYALMCIEAAPLLELILGNKMIQPNEHSVITTGEMIVTDVEPYDSLGSGIAQAPLWLFTRKECIEMISINCVQVHNQATVPAFITNVFMHNQKPALTDVTQFKALIDDEIDITWLRTTMNIITCRDWSEPHHRWLEYTALLDQKKLNLKYSYVQDPLQAN